MQLKETMSMPRQAVYDEQIRDARRTLVAIYGMIDSDGMVFASPDDLAPYTYQTAFSVRRHLAVLKKHGYLRNWKEYLDEEQNNWTHVQAVTLRPDGTLYQWAIDEGIDPRHCP